jgi:FkbM family methyltransferase
MKALLARLLGLAYQLVAPVAARLERFHGRSLLPLPPAYAYVQQDAVANLPGYLGAEPGDIRRIVVVGAWHGEEVPEMLERFPNCRVLALEPSREAYAQLSARFAAESRVTCLPVAASDVDGTTTFHETNLDGNGSLLPLARPDDAGAFTVPGHAETETYDVRTVRLDSLDELRDGEPIHCLWVDVQGLELPVLEGATALIDRVGAAFLEVATAERSYEGATEFSDLHAWMAGRGFRLASLGTDPVNGQGNALWLRAG